jgi:8-oxo-dGTP diphosphatase
MHAYLCPQENPEFTLLEHIDYKWLFKHQLRELDWAEADLPIVSALIER